MGTETLRKWTAFVIFTRLMIYSGSLRVPITCEVQRHTNASGSLSSARCVSVSIVRGPSLVLHELADEQAYEAELAECVGVTGYHRWFFLAALADALGLRLRAFAVEERGERLGVVPLLFRRRGPVSTVNYLPVPHVGPVLRGEALRAGRLPELLRAVEPILLRERVIVTKWAFAPGVDVPTGQLAARGFEVVFRENFVVPATTSVDGYLKALSSKRVPISGAASGAGCVPGLAPATRSPSGSPSGSLSPTCGGGSRPITAWPLPARWPRGSSATRGCCGGPSGTTSEWSR